MIIGQTGVGFPQVGTLFALIGNDFDKSVKNNQLALQMWAVVMFSCRKGITAATHWRLSPQQKM